MLTAFFNQQQIASIENVPAEVTPVVQLSGASAILRLRDRGGEDHTYDLSSVFQDGARYLFFSLRVGPTFAVQGDCLLGDSPSIPLEAFRQGRALGIRLQPLFLPQSSGDPRELVGRGVFYRGFHFPGSITPGNVSDMAICDRCRRSFRFQSFHAGFSNVVYFYCESGVHTLLVSSYAEGAPQLMTENPPEAIAGFEAKLPPCDRCSTRFRYFNPFRCPHCSAPYIDFERYPSQRAQEYYGNHLYRDRTQEAS